MKKRLLKCGVIALLLTGAISKANAQYPEIPQAVQKWSDSLLGAARKQSDIAWAKALPIIEKRSKRR